MKRAVTVVLLLALIICVYIGCLGEKAPEIPSPKVVSFPYTYEKYHRTQEVPYLVTIVNATTVEKEFKGEKYKVFEVCLTFKNTANFEVYGSPIVSLELKTAKGNFYRLDPVRLLTDFYPGEEKDTSESKSIPLDENPIELHIIEYIDHEPYVAYIFNL